MNKRNLKYFKRGYFGHNGNLYIFPVNLDENTRYGYIGNRQDAWAAWNDYFWGGITKEVLDEFFDESINDHEPPYWPKFDGNYWNFYSVDVVRTLTEVLEKRLNEEKNPEDRAFAEEFCFCMKELLGRCDGFGHIVFEGP